jgi:hypothetical protein
MLFFRNYRHPAKVVLCLTALLSGCVPSSRSAAPPIPPLNSRDAAVCYEPGVNRDAVVAVAETRLALASCRRSKQNVVAQYNEVRDSFGQNGGPE